MSHNTFGHLFRVTTWGESHGPALGCVVDGCPPGIPLTEADIQPWMDARKPGTSKFVTQRRESDTVKILSGVFTDDAGRRVEAGDDRAAVRHEIIAAAKRAGERHLEGDALDPLDLHFRRHGAPEIETFPRLCTGPPEGSRRPAERHGPRPPRRMRL